MVESEIDNLTPDPSFGHKLCFKCPNGGKPTLDIYVPRAFQWYKDLLNPIGFDPCNYFLKIWESIGTLTPKMGAHLGVWGFIPSHFFALPRTWNVTPKLHTWPAASQALALVLNPRLRLWHYDALPSPGVNALEGSPKCSCGKRDSEGRSRLQAL
jgi:hypothetical protein